MENLEMLQGKATAIEAALGTEFNGPGIAACYAMNSGDFVTTNYHGDPATVIESASMIVAKLLYTLNVTEGLDQIFENMIEGIRQGMIMFANEAANTAAKEDSADE